MPKFIKFFVFFLVAFLFFNGQIFALSGSSDDEKIPIPSKDFSVQITDAKNIQTAANRVTWNGKIFVTAKRGDSEITIPFEKIKSINLFLDKILEDGFIPANVALHNGTLIEVLLDSRGKCYGETEFGTFKLYVRNLLKVDFN